MRESWFLTNRRSQPLTLGDLAPLPSIESGKKADLLKYVSKSQVEQSDDLKSAINSGWVRLTKSRDNVKKVKTTSIGINDAIENVEKDEVKHYWGEMHLDEGDTIITVSEINVAYEVDGTIIGGNANGLTYTGAGELEVNQPGTYSVSWSMSVQSSTGNEIRGSVMINGISQSNGTNHGHTATANRGVSIGGHMITANLDVGDLVSLAVLNHTGINDIIVEHLNCVVFRIAE